MANTPWQDGFLSSLGLGVQTGYVDVLCLVREQVIDAVMKGGAYPIAPTVSSILQVNSLDFENDQPADYKTRMFGEGAETSTFQAAPASLRVSFKMPMLVTPLNWVDQPIAELWALARYANWGTPTIIRSTLIDSNGAPTTYNVGSTSLYLNNIADFTDIEVPFNATIAPGTNVEEVVSITDVNKYYRKVTLASGTSHSHSPNSIICTTLDASGGPDFEPSFGLLSLREGFLAPCLVNKLTITAKSGESVHIECNVTCGGIWRQEQVDIRQAISTIEPQRLTQVYRAVEGIAVQTSSGSESVATGQFGLSLPFGDRLFAGYEGLDLPSIGITSSTITIDNSIHEVYTPFSAVSSTKDRQRDQSYPYALVSDGRKISGRIDYVAPIEPWALAERLTAASQVNGGGVTLDYGACKIVIPDVAWKASSSNAEASSEPQARYIEWFMISDNYNSMPDLEYSTRGYN